MLGLTWVRAHTQRGDGWLLALSRLSLAGLEFVGATLSPEDTSLGRAKGGVLREPVNILVHGETALRRDG